MKTTKRLDGKLIGQLFLGALGLLLTAVGAWGYFAGQNDKIAGGVFVVFGVLAVLAAAFYLRVDHLVELGLLRIPHIRARRGESQLQEGRVIAAGDLEEARTALRQTLARFHVSTDAGASGLVLADDAVFAIAAMAPHEQAAVVGELARMSSAGYQMDLDLREIPRGDGARTYRMHRLPDSDIRVWYRQKSDSEPHALFVTVIEKTDRDN